MPDGRKAESDDSDMMVEDPYGKIEAIQAQDELKQLVKTLPNLLVETIQNSMKDAVRNAILEVGNEFAIAEKIAEWCDWMLQVWLAFFYSFLLILSALRMLRQF